MTNSRDLEGECWSAHDDAKVEGYAALRLKALELLVKIRVAGEKVKGDVNDGQQAKPSASLAKVHREING